MAKFEKINEKKESGTLEDKSEEELSKEEIKIKKKELKEKINRLKQIPDELSKANDYFDLKIEGEEIKKEILKSQQKHTKILTPYYEFETTEEWNDLRKKDIEYKLRLEYKSILLLKNQQQGALKQLFEQETRIKADIKRLKQNLRKLGIDINKLDDLQTKPEYIG